jgi:hypothetical protein
MYSSSTSRGVYLILVTLQYDFNLAMTTPNMVTSRPYHARKVLCLIDLPLFTSEHCSV